MSLNGKQNKRVILIQNEYFRNVAAKFSNNIANNKNGHEMFHRFVDNDKN